MEAPIIQLTEEQFLQIRDYTVAFNLWYREMKATCDDILRQQDGLAFQKYKVAYHIDIIEAYFAFKNHFPIANFEFDRATFIKWRLTNGSSSTGILSFSELKKGLRDGVDL